MVSTTFTPRAVSYSDHVTTSEDRFTLPAGMEAERGEVIYPVPHFKIMTLLNITCISLDIQTQLFSSEYGL